jgi:hypothetical protein
MFGASAAIKFKIKNKAYIYGCLKIIVLDWHAQ